jgi:hypothetical protein
MEPELNSGRTLALRRREPRVLNRLWFVFGGPSAIACVRLAPKPFRRWNLRLISRLPLLSQESHEVRTHCCPNAVCLHSRPVIRHGFYKTQSGKRRRYLCQVCGKIFRSTAGTPYHGLQHRRSTFDEVAALSVEGGSKPAAGQADCLEYREPLA